MFSRKPLLNTAIRRKFAVTLTGNEGTFAGILTEFDSESYVFENCTTPKGDEIAGRVFVDRIAVAYLQVLN
jgi:hypothetical protein